MEELTALEDKKEQQIGEPYWEQAEETYAEDYQQHLQEQAAEDKEPIGGPAPIADTQPLHDEGDEPEPVVNTLGSNYCTLEEVVAFLNEPLEESSEAA